MILQELLCIRTILWSVEYDRQLRKRLSQVNKRLKEHSVTTNSEKCVSSSALQFLGFIFSESGIRLDPALTTKIADAEIQSSSKELAGFLGLATYGRFIAEFNDFCTPLHEAKKHEESKLQWSDRNFRLLKQKLTSAPLLKPFVTTKQQQKQMLYTVCALSFAQRLTQLHTSDYIFFRDTLLVVLLWLFKPSVPHAQQVGDFGGRSEPFKCQPLICTDKVS